MADPLGLYKLLKVPQNSDHEEIKKSYRAKAKKAHPDAPKGNHDKFLELARAYRILSNEDLRARYDSTGEVNEQAVISLHAEMIQCLVSAFRQVLGIVANNTEKVDFIGELKKHFNDTKSQGLKNKVQVVRKIDILETLKKRIDKEGDGRNIFVVEIDTMLTDLQGKMKIVNRNIEVFESCLEELSLYKSEVELVRHVVMFSPTATGSTATSTFGVR